MGCNIWRRPPTALRFDRWPQVVNTPDRHVRNKGLARQVGQRDSYPLAADVPKCHVRWIWATITKGPEIRRRDKLRDLVVDRERDGSEIAKIVPPEGNRVDVKIDQIPVHVRDAVMAAEDRDFYSNPGFSFTGFARAFLNNL